MTIEGLDWSRFVPSAAASSLIPGVFLLAKLFRRKRPKLTEEEKLQAKHAKTRSKVDQAPEPTVHLICKECGRALKNGYTTWCAKCRDKHSPRKTGKPRMQDPPQESMQRKPRHEAVVPLPGGRKIPVAMGEAARIANRSIAEFGVSAQAAGKALENGLCAFGKKCAPRTKAKKRLHVDPPDYVRK